MIFKEITFKQLWGGWIAFPVWHPTCDEVYELCAEHDGALV
jgi:hypothetical protein